MEKGDCVCQIFNMMVIEKKLAEQMKVYAAFIDLNEEYGREVESI